MNYEIDKLLSFDPIAEVEKCTGKGHWSKFDEADNKLALAVVMISNERKREALQEINDTYFGIKFNDFIDLLLNNGFKKAIQYAFKNKESYHQDTDQFACCYREDGLIVVFDSYGDSLNCGKIYGNCKKNEDADTMYLGCSRSPIVDELFGFDYDVREGMLHFIAKIKFVGELLPIWKDTGCFNWMIDRSERSYDGEPYESWSKRYCDSTLLKIKQCPQEFQNIVAVYEQEAIRRDSYGDK